MGSNARLARSVPKKLVLAAQVATISVAPIMATKGSTHPRQNAGAPRLGVKVDLTPHFTSPGPLIDGPQQSTQRQ